VAILKQLSGTFHLGFRAQNAHAFIAIRLRRQYQEDLRRLTAGHFLRGISERPLLGPSEAEVARGV
jgi:hypothetical protein